MRRDDSAGSTGHLRQPPRNIVGADNRFDLAREIIRRAALGRSTNVGHRPNLGKRAESERYASIVWPPKQVT
jgi:hypothetical protein